MNSTSAINIAKDKIADAERLLAQARADLDRAERAAKAKYPTLKRDMSTAPLASVWLMFYQFTQSGKRYTYTVLKTGSDTYRLSDGRNYTLDEVIDFLTSGAYEPLVVRMQNSTAHHAG